MTNNEKINNMSVEEKAEFMCYMCPPSSIGKDCYDAKFPCIECWIDYLNEEVEE